LSNFSFIKTKKPSWLNKKIELKKCKNIFLLLKDLNLHTICQEAKCPNISECYFKGVATFLILGNICTRNCRFCAVKKGKPQELDYKKPERIVEAIKRLKLKHVVITSVTRDDLEDGGASVFRDVVIAIRKELKDVKIELLIPDFKGSQKALREIIGVKPDLIAHNVETVPRLYKEIRWQANYGCSLKILELIKKYDKNIYTKSGIMLGLGEKEKEVLDVLLDLRKVNCDFLSIGQYLAPSKNHFPVKEYIAADKFIYYKAKALEFGFLYVASGPYVRSSYLASDYLNN
jgi:lipoic acid synthetase